MIRGDLFRLEKELLERKYKIYNKYCINVKAKTMLFLKDLCLDEEKGFITGRNFEEEFEWQHSVSFLAKTLNYEVFFKD